MFSTVNPAAEPDCELPFAQVQINRTAAATAGRRTELEFTIKPLGYRI
jgi:hypothetical protein